MSQIRRTLNVSGFIILGLFATAAGVLAQGPLTPPSPPAPVLKTLDQVEPRKPICAPDLPTTIATPGSYYLVESIRFTSPNTNGIVIASPNVSIDLMGFSLIGPGAGTGNTGYGIVTSGLCNYLTIQNGCVNGWRNDGIHLGYAPGLATSSSAAVSRVYKMTISENGGNGLYAANHSEIRECLTAANGSSGICIWSVRTTVQDCISSP